MLKVYIDQDNLIEAIKKNGIPCQDCEEAYYWGSDKENFLCPECKRMREARADFEELKKNHEL